MRLTLLVVLLAVCAPSQTINWMRYYPVDCCTYPMAITRLPDGRIFMAGGFPDSVLTAFDADGQRMWSRPQTEDLSRANSLFLSRTNQLFLSGTWSSSRSVVARYDLAGNPVWLNKTMEWYDAEGDRITAMGTDFAGNVYGAGIAIGETRSRYLVRKYDPNGNRLFNRFVTLDDLHYWAPTQVAVDGLGNMYFPMFGSNTGLLNKYDAQGALVWTKETPQIRLGFSTQLDADGNVLIAGNLPGDGGPAVAKFSPGGELIWVRPLSHTTAQYLLPLSDGGAIVAGGTGYSPMGAWPRPDTYCTKIDRNGNVVWVRTFGGDYWDYVRGIAAGPNGTFYLAGITHEAAPVSFYPVNYSIWIASLNDVELAGTYRTWSVASQRAIEENGTDRLISTRRQTEESDARFAVVKQQDGSYKIRGVASGRWLNEDAGDRLISTRTQPDDGTARFVLLPQDDGSFQVKSQGSGLYWKEGAGQLIAGAAEAGKFLFDAAVDVTVTTEPAGLAVRVDGQSYSGAKTFSWIRNSAHVVEAENVTTGESRHRFLAWSNGGVARQSITVGNPLTLTARFDLQHRVRTAAAPASGGTVTVVPQADDGFHNAGSTVQLSATPFAGYSFSGFTGDISGTANPQSLVISGPATVTASFGTSCGYTVSPESLAFSAAGGSAVLTIGAASGCSWSVAGAPVWLSASPGSGTGPGTVSLTVAANAASARAATFTVAGRTVNVSQVGTGLRFVPVTPCRVVDTRDTTRLGAGETRAFAMSACGISRAAAYSLNVTVVPAGPLSYLTLWPWGQLRPLASTLNSMDGTVRANAAIVPAGVDGAVNVFVTDATHVILDINGYFTAPQ